MQKTRLNISQFYGKMVWVKTYGNTEYYGILLNDDYFNVYLRLEKVKDGRWEHKAKMDSVIIPKSSIDEIFLDCGNKCRWWLKNGV
jgi:small nuclear ribonucleoprotein (snRNP)-like protein